jgi:DNA repair photolyase
MDSVGLKPGLHEAAQRDYHNLNTRLTVINMGSIMDVLQPDGYGHRPPKEVFVAFTKACIRFLKVGVYSLGFSTHARWSHPQRTNP